MPSIQLQAVVFLLNLDSHVCNVRKDYLLHAKYAIHSFYFAH